MTLGTAPRQQNRESPPALDNLAAFLKAAGDPLRLEVLQVLGQNSFGVLELCEIMAMKQSGMSHHLKVLAQGGLVERRREGNSIYYRRSLPPAHAAAGTVQGVRATPIVRTSRAARRATSATSLSGKPASAAAPAIL